MSLVPQTPGTIATGVHIDQERVLQALNLNPRDPKVQALILVCQTYGLDPILKHAVLISGNLYVTRDGLLAVAHRSGDLDGIVVEDEGETADEWWAKVSVYRKGVTHPFTYRGRYAKSGTQKKYGPEMAVKCAEVMALRRAFGVTGIATVEEQWDAHDSAIDAQLVDRPAPDDPAGDPAAVADLVARLNALPEQRRKQAKQAFVARFGRPEHLRQSQMVDADMFVAQIEAGPANPVSFPGEGEPASEVNPAGDDRPQEEATEGVNGMSAEGSPPAPPEPVADPVAGDGVDAVAVPARGTGQPPIDVPSFVDEHDSPVTAFHNAVKVASVMLPAGATDSDLRHAVISRATEGETEDWRQAHGEPMEAATEALTQVAEGTLVLHRTALGWELRLPRDGEGPPPLAELRALIARVKGLGEARVMIRARRLAQDAGLPMVADFEGLAGSPELLALVTAEVRAEAEAVAA